MLYNFDYKSFYIKSESLKKHHRIRKDKIYIWYIIPP